MLRRELYLWPFAKKLYHGSISTMTSWNEISWIFLPPKWRAGCAPDAKSKLGVKGRPKLTETQHIFVSRPVWKLYMAVTSRNWRQDLWILHITNYLRVKNLIVSRDAIHTLKFRSPTFPLRCATAQYHQPICAVKSHSRALATVPNIWKLRKQEAI